MKHFKHLFAFASLVTLSLTAGNVEDLVNNLSSDSYDLRHQSLIELQAEVAMVTNAETNIADKKFLENSFLQYVSKESTPLQTKVYLTRLLGIVGEREALGQLSEIALSSQTTPLLRENAIQAIALNPTESASDVLLNGIEKATKEDQRYWWAALGSQASSKIDGKFKNWLTNTQVNLTEDAILSIGKIGGSATTEFLYQTWKKTAENDKTKMEHALLHTGCCSKKMLEDLLKNGSNASIKIAAYLQLTSKDPQMAHEFLSKQLNKNPGRIRSDFIHAALNSGEPILWELVIGSIEKLTESELKILFVSINENKLTEYESTLLPWIDNPVVGTTAIRSLASIGGAASSEKLIQTLQSDSENVQDAAIYSLSRIIDPDLDETMLKLAINTKDPAHRSAIQVLSIRNGTGAVELINQLIYKGADEDTLKALLAAAEKIGNMDTCKVLASAVINETNKSKRKKYQITLKRLSSSLLLNDPLWTEVYHPALMLASQIEQKISLIEILDGISSDGALAYCINLEQNTTNDAILKSIGSVFKRWRNLNISHYWLERIERENLPSAEVKSSIRSVIRLMKSEYLQATEQEISTTCANLFLGSSNNELREEIFSVVETLNRWKRRDFVNLLKPALDISKYKSQIEEQIDPLWR